jgi:hypothetical protein
LETRLNAGFTLDPPRALDMESVFASDSFGIASDFAKVKSPHISRMMSHRKLEAH